MSKAEYALLQDVIMDADFPDLDLALRRGRHVDRDDAEWYSLLTDAQELLEPFYRRYGCELIHKTDGYFYLLPTGDKVSRKQLAATDMLVGQALALLYLDPAAVERGGVVTQEEVVSQLSAVLGSDALIGVFSPGKRKAKDERIAQRNVRQRVGEAMRRLAVLGFVELSEENAVRLRAALLRFAEPVRGLSEPAEALAKLVAQGEVALAPDESDSDSDLDSDDARERVEDEPDRTTLVGVPAPDLGVAGFRGVVADGGGGSVATPSAADVRGYEANDGARAQDALVDLDLRAVEPRDAVSAGSDADSFASGPEGDGAALGRASDDGVEPHGAEIGGVEALVSERAERDLAELDVVHAEDDLADTLAGIGAPKVEEDDEAVEDDADGGESERSAVVRKPRGPVSRDDLDWADILVPEPDAEDGS